MTRQPKSMLEAQPRNPSALKVRDTYEALSVASVGIEMGVSVLIGWGLGTYLDKHFDTEPYLMLTLLGCGVAAAFRGIFRVGRLAKRQAEREEDIHE